MIFLSLNWFRPKKIDIYFFLTCGHSMFFHQIQDIPLNSYSFSVNIDELRNGHLSINQSRVREWERERERKSCLAFFLSSYIFLLTIWVYRIWEYRIWDCLFAVLSICLNLVHFLKSFRLFITWFQRDESYVTTWYKFPDEI